MHCLLHVGEARNILSCDQGFSQSGALSSYVVCRVFGSKDKIRSEIVWNKTDPDFSISEVGNGNSNNNISGNGRDCVEWWRWSCL